MTSSINSLDVFIRVTSVPGEAEVILQYVIDQVVERTAFTLYGHTAVVPGAIMK